MSAVDPQGGGRWTVRAFPAEPTRFTGRTAEKAGSTGRAPLHILYTDHSGSLVHGLGGAGLGYPAVPGRTDCEPGRFPDQEITRP